MADRQKSHFGSDGYRDLGVREEKSKRTKNSYTGVSGKTRKQKEAEVLKLRKENNKLKGA